MKGMRILVLMLLVAGGAAYAQEDIHERVAADPRGHVEISNLAGSVVVTGWNRDEVEVTGTLGRGSERLDVEAEGDRVIIKVVLPKGRNQNIKGSDLEVRIPEGSDLEVSTVSANIDVADVSGSLSLNTVSGNVEVEGDTELKGDAGDRATVLTTVKGKKVAADVDYQFHVFQGDAGPEWRAFDIVVDEVSMALNWRKQFKNIIKKKGFPALLDKIAKKVEKQRAKAEGSAE